MLAKDAAGQTVKVARGLHDLSEMEGVKVLLSLSLFLIIRVHFCLYMGIKGFSPSSS